MSRCNKTHLLEGAVRGEQPLEPLVEHAQDCPRCRHELQWLETERKLFRERAAREEVEQLWAGMAKRGVVAPRRSARRALLALAAGLLMVVGASRMAGHLPSSSADRDASVSDRFEALMTENAFSPERAELCSRADGTIGFHCGGYVLASR